MNETATIYNLGIRVNPATWETGLRGEGRCAEPGCGFVASHDDLMRVTLPPKQGRPGRRKTRITAGGPRIACAAHPFARISYRVMRVVVDAGIRCDDRCKLAGRNSTCRCICGGVYHGNIRARR